MKADNSNNTEVKQDVSEDWYFNSIDGDNAIVNEKHGFILEAPDEKTGRFICKCVNAHEELVKALQRFVDFACKALKEQGETYESAMIREAKEALKKANQ